MGLGSRGRWGWCLPPGVWGQVLDQTGEPEFKPQFSNPLSTLPQLLSLNTNQKKVHHPMLDQVDGELFHKSDAKSSASLYMDVQSNLQDRVLGEVEEDSFIALPGKGEHCGLKTMCLNLGKIATSFIESVQRGHDQLVGIVLMGWW